MGWCIGVELMPHGHDVHLGSIDHGERVRDYPHRRNCAHTWCGLQRAIWHSVLPDIDSPAPSMREVSI